MVKWNKSSPLRPPAPTLLGRLVLPHLIMDIFAAFLWKGKFLVEATELFLIIRVNEVPHFDPGVYALLLVKLPWEFQPSTPTATSTAEDKWRWTLVERQGEISLCNPQWEMKRIWGRLFLKAIRWNQYANGIVSIYVDHCETNCCSIWVAPVLVSLRSWGGFWPSTVETQAFCGVPRSPVLWGWLLFTDQVHMSWDPAPVCSLVFLAVDFKEI